MSNQEQRDSILQQFTCAHIRLTRASAHGAGGADLYHWAPDCVHPKMHTVFNGDVRFCDRCPCYMARFKVR